MRAWLEYLQVQSFLQILQGEEAGSQSWHVLQGVSSGLGGRRRMRRERSRHNKTARSFARGTRHHKGLRLGQWGWRSRALLRRWLLGHERGTCASLHLSAMTQPFPAWKPMGVTCNQKVWDSHTSGKLGRGPCQFSWHRTVSQGIITMSPSPAADSSSGLYFVNNSP